MGLREAVNKFAAGVDDLATLEVTTYTGSLVEAIDENTGELDWSRFRPSSGALVLAVATRVQADMDTINFRANHEGIDDLEALYALHQASVESAQAGRLALVELFKGVLSAI